MAIVISVCNQKGGVGKTTTVINLAAALAREHHKRVLVIDSDPQHNSTLVLGTMTPFDYPLLYDSLISENNVKMRDCIYQTKYPKSTSKKDYPQIDIIPSNMELFGCTTIGSDPKSAFISLRDKLTEEVHDAYDFILIDCPPNINTLLNNAFSASDYYLIPIKSEDWFALKGMQQLQTHVDFIKESFNKKLAFLGALITMRDNRTKLSESMGTAINTYFKNMTFETSIRNNTDINIATSKRKTVFEHAPKANGALDYSAAAKELLQRIENKMVSDEMVSKRYSPYPQI